MPLILASCSPQPNWMPKKPKLMFQICQKLRRGLFIRPIPVFDRGGQHCAISCTQIFYDWDASAPLIRSGEAARQTSSSSIVSGSVVWFQVAFPNPTNGSSWIIHTRLHSEAIQSPFLNPTNVPWVDCSGPAYTERDAGHPLLFISSRREEIKKRSVTRGCFRCRLDLNYPPNAVGGIWTFRTVSAVGGIWTFRTVSCVGGIRKSAELEAQRL